MLIKGERTFVVRDMGGFIVHINMPGWLQHKPTDHGHGPLAMVVESILHPGRVIAMHEHRNDEIISWVPAGVMRHEDKITGRLITDRNSLMVMNAGRSFWHSEETLQSDPPLRMLQVLVRPSAMDLEPKIQHGPIPSAEPNLWRHLVGPEGSKAPFYVRNAVDFFDIRLEADAVVAFPHMPGRDLYFHVFTGSVVAHGQKFDEREQGLLLSGAPLTMRAKSSSVVVAFLLDPHAPVVRRGTVGDHRKIPPPIVIRAVKGWKRLQRLWLANWGFRQGVFWK